MHTFIKRRKFLQSLSAIGLIPLFSSKAIANNAFLKESGSKNTITSDLKITKLEFIRLTGIKGNKSIYLKAITDNGIEGLYGPIDEDAALIADKLLKNKVIGQSPLATEAIWDNLFQSHRQSRGSYYFMGMSAIDNVLWDLKGKLFNQPVYKLLGGDRNKVEVYASCQFSHEPAQLQAKAREVKNMGYKHQKWFLVDKVSEDEPIPVIQNVELVRLLREAIGDDSDLMIDAGRVWSLPYCIEFAKKVEKYNLFWLEEPVQSIKLDAFIELSRETTVPLATGEHFYGRWDVHSFLKEDAIRVVQSDPEWCGGVSELIKICTIASIYGAYVIPHGHSMHAAMHVVASQPYNVCPMAEYLITKMEGTYYYFEKNPPLPVKGILTLTDKPGFGIELDPSKITKTETITWRDL